MNSSDLRRRCRSLAPALLVALLPAAGCARPVAAPMPRPAPGPFANVVSQLQSAQLPFDPMPPRRVKPILRDLIDRGYRAQGDLQLTMTPLRAHYKHWQRVQLYEVRFTSHLWGGKPVSIFGFYGYPAIHSQRLPGLLLVHGGGGYATADRVIEAGGRGYAALSIDLPGKGTLREKHSRSTGPDMTVEQIFTVKPQLTDNYLYNAVLAQMRSITFLQSRPEVDPNRIGLVGVSWGGATGLMTTSLDKRVKCFVDLFGSGFLKGGSTWHDYFDRLPPGEFQEWEDNFDAMHYVQDITVPVLGVTGTNDNCYYLPRFMRTLGGIRPLPELLLRPNLDHKIDEVAREGYYKWLGMELRGEHRDAPPGLEAMRVTPGARGIRVWVRPRGGVAVKGADVCYGPVGEVGWTNRKWVRVEATADPSKSWWSADFALPSQIAYTFATVYFTDGSVLTTPVHSVARISVNGSPLALDTPYMYRGPLQVEAHYFAGFVDAEFRADPENSKVLLVRNGRSATCEAQRLGDMYFVKLRDLSDGLGGSIEWDKAHTAINLPKGRGA